MDAIDHYAQFIFGVPWNVCVGGVPGARSLMDVAPSKYWIKIWNNPADPNQYPLPGDVLVYDGDGWNKWGHTAPALTTSPQQATVVQQDGFAAPLVWVDGGLYSDKPAHYAVLRYEAQGTGPLRGWLRPRPDMMIQDPADVVVQGEIVSEEAELNSDERKMLESAYRDAATASRLAQVAVDAIIHGGTSMLYGASLQKLIDDIPRRVAQYPVLRGGKEVYWIQDTADGTSLAMSLQQKVLPALAQDLKITPKSALEAFQTALQGMAVNVSIGAAPTTAVQANPPLMQIEAPAE